MNLTGEIIVGIGAFFLFLGSLGIVKMPDVYNRLQAGTKCTTFGGFFTIIGVGIIEPQWFWKCLIIAVFILLGNPLSNHALGRAAKKTGVPLCKKTIIDKSKDFKGYEEIK
ncbi:Na+/H+ antiporter subunit G [bacterium]|nr:Na+/H+ antiporter subunit G [bacterium]